MRALGMSRRPRGDAPARSSAPRWRRWGDAVRVGTARADLLLLRAVLVVALLLASVIVAGVARHALGIPAVTPAAAVGIAWLMGCVEILGWAVLVVGNGYRARGPRG